MTTTDAAVAAKSCAQHILGDVDGDICVPFRTLSVCYKWQSRLLQLVWRGATSECVTPAYKRRRQISIYQLPRTTDRSCEDDRPVIA